MRYIENCLSGCVVMYVNIYRSNELCVCLFNECFLHAPNSSFIKICVEGTAVASEIKAIVMAHYSYYAINSLHNPWVM